MGWDLPESRMYPDENPLCCC
ncbi:hypothetical protein GBAR_LOCUS22398 [Geodia barretti]|uniref:Uncharacterized protein n=1 Tax=Geodia barretti TaxID=519541 RepID=A0AA35X759_GEOBA|nr:hypothetical protein GBAR_LOCUS22398 [Geodia barretti]